MNEKQLSEQANAAVTAVSRIAGELVEVGASWIRHGLTVGESSLKTSARSLEATARVLGEVAGRLRSLRS